jgi:hypothetical protein
MTKINARWHKKNKMPKNATLQERINWHKAHLKHCGCRKDVPETLKKYL